MTTYNTMKKILLALCAVLAVMMAAPAPASAKTKTDTAANDNDTAAVSSAITISEELKIEDVTDASSLEKIGAAYDAETNTLRFQSDLSLEQRLIISPKQTLIIDLNGHTVTGSIFEIQNRKKAPVTLTGTGTFQKCKVDKYGDGKLTLDGDIEYYAGDSTAFSAVQGESVIKNGNFYAAENHCAVCADYDYELGDSYLYIKGGNINGPLILDNIRTTIYGGNINGRIANCCGLYIKGGVIQKGIVTYVGSEDATGSITISGGKVLDQILIDDYWGSRLTITLRRSFPTMKNTHTLILPSPEAKLFLPVKMAMESRRLIQRSPSRAAPLPIPPKKEISVFTANDIMIIARMSRHQKQPKLP